MVTELNSSLQSYLIIRLLLYDDTLSREDVGHKVTLILAAYYYFDKHRLVTIKLKDKLYPVFDVLQKAQISLDLSWESWFFHNLLDLLKRDWLLRIQELAL